MGENNLRGIRTTWKKNRAVKRRIQEHETKIEQHREKISVEHGTKMKEQGEQSSVGGNDR